MTPSISGSWGGPAIACCLFVAGCGSQIASDGAASTTGLSTNAAGANDGAAGSCAAAVALPLSSNTPACGGRKLVSASPITITTPDPDPSNPALTSSPTGDRFLAAWTDGGWSVNGVIVPETVWTTMIPSGATGVPASAAVELTASGACPVATWNAAGFAVAWGDAAGLHLQQVDDTGAPTGAPSLVLSRPNVQACPTSIVATSGGLALAWYEGLSALQENVGLVGPGGAIVTPVQLAAVGPGFSFNTLLGVIGSETYAAFVDWSDGGSASTAVARIDWAQGVAVPEGEAPGFLGSLVGADGQLWFTTDGSNGVLAYGGALGTGFPATVGSCNGTAGAGLVADGCGRIVEVGTGGATPAGVAEGFYVQPLQSDAPAVELGGVTGSAVFGSQSTFGVLWYARIGPGVPFPGEEPETGTLSFTTLSWQ